MCGIAGIVSLGAGPVREGARRVAGMVSLLHHRGPDAQGVLASRDQRVVFGNTRLAIIDAQTEFPVPMPSGDGSAMLTFNGEIYDHVRQRQRLQTRGVAFRTKSDTEVLLEGLQLDGEDFAKQLDGFWGFGYFDARDGRVLLARDLLGERQVYYRRTRDEIVFASEVNPILADMEGRAEFDHFALASAFRYRAAPPDRTLIDGIRRLEAGHLMDITADGRVDMRRYLHLRPSRWSNFFASQPSLDTVVDLFDEQIAQACQDRVPQEVGYMTTLSGGLDSTLVNVYASDLGQREIRSLYGESAEVSPRRGVDLSEAEASSLTSQRLGTRHTKLDMCHVDASALTAETAENAFDGVLCEGALAFQLLAKEVRRQDARVIILSDGPDELIGGYPKDIAALRIDGQIGRSSSAAIAEDLRCGVRAGDMDGWPLPEVPADDRLNWTYLRHQPFSFRPIHGGTPDGQLVTLFGEALAQRTRHVFGNIAADYDPGLPALDTAQRMSLSYALNSLPAYFNCRSDRGTMRESVESRMPFQAPSLVELMIATPARYRYDETGKGKLVLRKLVERHVGPEIAHRGKYGFYTPSWQRPELSHALRLHETIAECAVFNSEPFLPGARDFLLASGQTRLLWLAYCVARVSERLRQRDYGYANPVPAKAGQAAFATAVTGNAKIAVLQMSHGQLGSLAR